MCFMSAGCGGFRARGTQGWLQSVAKRQGPVWICEVEEKNDALSCEVKTSSPVSSSPPRFSGTTHFAPGRWIGVELEDTRGKNDGSVGGKEYFSCPDNHGLFVRSTQVQVREEGEAKTLTHSSSVSFLTRWSCQAQAPLGWQCPPLVCHDGAGHSEARSLPHPLPLRRYCLAPSLASLPPFISLSFLLFSPNSLPVGSPKSLLL